MTRITIVVPDKMIIVGDRPLKIEDLDWGRFDGDQSTPWDDIHAVQFDETDNQGTVEYRQIVTNPPGRPNIKPGNRGITRSEFDAEFAWVVPLHAARKAHLEEVAKMEAERAAMARAERGETAQESASDVERRVAELEDQITRLRNSAAQVLAEEV